MTSPSSSHAVGHTSLLDRVDRRALLDSPPTEADHHYAAMVDGRAIHLHFQFVEPLLCELFPEACLRAETEALGISLDGALSPRLLARPSLELLARRPAGSVTRAPGITIDLALANGILSERDAGTFAPELIGEALDVLDRARLGFFVDLAVGAVVLSDARFPETICAVPVSPRSFGDALAEALLRGAAHELGRLWFIAEAVARGEPDPTRLSGVHRRALRLFCGSVVRELRRRLGTDSPSPRRGAPHRVLAWLDQLHARCLCRELFACWYPGWRRSLFIFDSPFDTMTDLRQLRPTGRSAA